MDVATFASHVQALPYGKKLPRATYLYAPDSSLLPAELGQLIQRLRDDLAVASDFNVVKFTHDGGISFLKYPRFHDLPHPELSESVRVSLVTGKVSRSRYGADGNPPILHRKEAFVAADDPAATAWARLTAQEENAGLYDHPVVIGFKATWEGLLRDKGLAYRGHDLIEAQSGDSIELEPLALPIHRHRTALYRTGLSKPIRVARPSRDNATKVWNALERFGAPRSRLTPESFTERDIVYQIGLPPNRIDILTDIDGVTFEEAWKDRVPCPVEGGSYSMISRHHLLANKRASGRPQDLADVARLEEGV